MNVKYKCKENDNHIRVLINGAGISEIHVSDASKRVWTVIGFNDLMNAMGKAYNKIIDKNL